MKFDEQYAVNAFNTMLSYDEKSLCPIYCMFKETGFFANPSHMIVGFATITSCGRLLIARYFLVDGLVKNELAISMIKSCKIKKTLFGQYEVEMAFPTQKKDFKLRLQAAPKILGSNFPNQRQNLTQFISILESQSSIKL